MSAIQPGRGQLESRVVLAWTARGPCTCCVEFEAARSLGVVSIDCQVTPSPDPRAVQVHHYPHKGMGGAKGRDDRVVPLCAHHHDQAHRYFITREDQIEWTLENLARFLDQASTEEVQQYVRDLERWKERPRWIPS